MHGHHHIAFEGKLKMKTIKRLVGMFIFAIVVTVSVLYVQLPQRDNSKLYEEITVNQINNIINQSDCYIAFYSKECGSCRKLERDLEELIEDKKINIEKPLYGLDLDAQDESVDSLVLFEKYQVEGVPFVVKYSNGSVDCILYDDIVEYDIKKFFKE